MKNISQQMQENYQPHIYEIAMKHIANILIDRMGIGLDDESISSIDFVLKDQKISKATITYTKICITDSNGKKVFWPIQPYAEERPIQECYELLQKFKPQGTV